MSFLTDETLFAGTLSDSDLIHMVDVSNTTQNPAGSSFKLTIGQLKASMTNIYNSNGTLTADRTVLMAGNYLSFQGGMTGFGTVPNDNSRIHAKGVNSTITDYIFYGENSSGYEAALFRNDGHIFFGENNVIGGLVTVNIMQRDVPYGLYINNDNSGAGGFLISGKTDEVLLASNTAVPFHLMMNTAKAISMVGTSVGIYNSTPHASAVLDVVSTTKGFAPPRMTTAQKNAIATPFAGLSVFDTDLGKLCVYTTAWETVTSV